MGGRVKDFICAAWASTYDPNAFGLPRIVIPDRWPIVVGLNWYSNSTIDDVGIPKWARAIPRRGQRALTGRG